MKTLLLILFVTNISFLTAQLQQQIDNSLELATKYILKHRKQGHWNSNGDAPGSTALGAFTLLHAGTKSDDIVIQRNLEYLYLKGCNTTYGISLLLMLIEKAYFTNNSKKIPKRVHSWVKKLAAWLVGAQSRSGYWGYKYSFANNDDLSNTQFAILGLYSAHRCGVKIPEKVWERSLEALVRFQENKGTTVDMEFLISNERIKSSQARAWGYKPKGSYRGSMVAAGASCLLIIDHMLENSKKYDSRAKKIVRQAIADGLAWLTLYFDVTAHPANKGNSLDNWKFYYLYGLERLGRISQIDYLGNHNWYEEGAKHIIDEQKKDGSWGNFADTCFAILFLTKATPQIKPEETKKIPSVTTKRS